MGVGGAMENTALELNPLYRSGSSSLPANSKVWVLKDMQALTTEN